MSGLTPARVIISMMRLAWLTPTEPHTCSKRSTRHKKDCAQVEDGSSLSQPLGSYTTRHFLSQKKKRLPVCGHMTYFAVSLEGSNAARQRREREQGSKKATE